MAPNPINTPMPRDCQVVACRWLVASNLSIHRDQNLLAAQREVSHLKNGPRPLVEVADFCRGKHKAIEAMHCYCSDLILDDNRARPYPIFPSSLTHSNSHHCQQVHELRRRHELRGAGFVPGKLGDERDLHMNDRFFIAKCGAGNRL